MKHKHYIICLLDLHNDREQKSIFFLETNKSHMEIGEKFSISSKLKKLLADRWELHVNEVERQKTAFTSSSFTVVNVITKVIAVLEKHNVTASRTVLLPANTLKQD